MRPPAATGHGESRRRGQEGIHVARPLAGGAVVGVDRPDRDLCDLAEARRAAARGADCALDAAAAVVAAAVVGAVP